MANSDTRLIRIGWGAVLCAGLACGLKIALLLFVGKTASAPHRAQESQAGEQESSPITALERVIVRLKAEDLSSDELSSAWACVRAVLDTHPSEPRRTARVLVEALFAALEAGSEDWPAEELFKRSIQHCRANDVNWAAAFLEQGLGQWLISERRVADALTQLRAASSWTQGATDDYVSFLHSASCSIDLMLGQLELWAGNASNAQEAAERVAQYLGPLGGDDPVVLEQRLTLAVLSADIWLELGLVDQAIASHDEELRLATLAQEVLETDDHIRGALLHKLDIPLATRRFTNVIKAATELLKSEQFLERSPERAMLMARRGRARLEDLRRGGTSSPVEAERDFALAEEGELGTLDRIDAALSRAELSTNTAVAQQHLERAGALLDETRPSAGGPSPLVEREAVYLALKSNSSPETVPFGLLAEAGTRTIATWRAQRPRPGGTSFLIFGDRRLVLAELVRRSDTALEALDWVIQAQLSGSLAKRLGTEAPSAESVVKRLTQSGGQLYVWVAGRDETVLIEANSAGVRRRNVALPFTLEADAQRLRRELNTADQGSQKWIETGRGLIGDLGLDALVAASPKGVVHLASVGLTLPPIELLATSTESHGSPVLLGEGVAFATLPSLALVSELDSRSRAPSGQGAALLTLASPMVSDSMTDRWPKTQAFPLTERDLRCLQSGFAPQEVSLWLGTDATFSRLTGRGAREASAWHLLVHGIIDVKRERSVGLALAPSGTAHDGELWCAEVDTLHAPPLVLLSACMTAKGPLRTGDDVAANLGGAFLTAGAQAVVLAERPVTLSGALRFQELALMRMRGHGDSPAEALRSAREQLAADASATHPVNRAFGLVGLGDVPLFPASHPR